MTQSVGIWSKSVTIRTGTAANDVVYSFEQDALGRQTAVKVGNQILSQSAYQNDPTKPNFGTLTATTYGNGAKISSRYDDFQPRDGGGSTAKKPRRDTNTTTTRRVKWHESATIC